MTDIEKISNESIRDLIADTESTLGELKAELMRREIAAQDMEIEHLEEHMRGAKLSLNTIKDFLAYLLVESRSKN
ncbi:MULTISPECIES: hypothetical protein [Pirellulaceae]|uniref:Uncharacterized protein n=1 Tax=Aporhodopirellula rubra TaxID=980271 RepID=A0A7W5H3X3_9BACT|nr:MULTISPECIES: hypothetical protein [Pirellulaceae]EMI44983.1 hypothetical protein RRSWK_02404 [Rhodopirellula sp. SWK7]MBB3204774.1 hypothetical protein [Aporhodopirellula rubra]